MPDKPVGAALVVGGGVGGIQAAIDLAESGIKVYLVDKEPSVGGVMAQLDKTFPTNDCAMCTLAPRLVEAGRHKDIELLTLSEVTGFKGEPGNFTATVVKHPRYVNEEICKGCGRCATHCLVRFQPQFRERENTADLLGPAERNFMDGILADYEHEKGILVSVLQDIDRHYRYLPAHMLKYTAEKLNLPLPQVYHAATFYTSFSLTPRGLYHLKVCMGTACHVRGSARILDEFERRLGITAGETTADLLFTLETVNCLGCCAFGPVVMMNESYLTLSTGQVADAIQACRDESEKAYETAAVSTGT